MVHPGDESWTHSRAGSYRGRSPLAGRRLRNGAAAQVARVAFSLCCGTAPEPNVDRSSCENAVTTVEGMMEMGMEPGRLLRLAEEMATRAREEDVAHAALAVLAAHTALEATVNRLGGETIGSFNYRARFLPKWHDLCERAIGRQLEAAPDLERLQALRDAVVRFRGGPRAAGPPVHLPSPRGAPGGRNRRGMVGRGVSPPGDRRVPQGRRKGLPRLGVTGAVMEKLAAL